MKDLVNNGVNVIAYEKNNHKYGMTCAWMMNADYDMLMMIIGSQSDLGNSLEVGDIIGISALNSKQTSIAKNFGEGHSLEVDKFASISYYQDESAILIPSSSRELKCEVVHIGKLYANDEDKLVYVKVLEGKGTGSDFLSMPKYRQVC